MAHLLTVLQRVTKDCILVVLVVVTTLLTFPPSLSHLLTPVSRDHLSNKLPAARTLTKALF